MKTLAVFEIDGVLDQSPRAVAVAKQALANLDWEIVFLTARSEGRSAETLAFLADRLKVSRYPKTAPTLWCGRDSEPATRVAKIQTFQSLMRQHHSIERVVAYDNDETVLNGFDTFIRSRGQPRSFALYRIDGGAPVSVYGSAVYAKRDPTEF